MPPIRTSKNQITLNNATKVKIAGRSLQPTLLLDELFLWMSERHQIYLRRLQNRRGPWSKDPIFQEYKFTNVYRVLDRTTQYLIKNVINTGPQTHVECCFRVLLFRIFNRIETWELLVENLGTLDAEGEKTLTWDSFEVDKYLEVLQDAHDQGVTLYTSAYQIHAPPMGGDNSFHNHLNLVDLMIREGLPQDMLEAEDFEDAYWKIDDFVTMGPFLGYQMLLDLSMTPHVEWDMNSFVRAGPGSKAGLQKVFGPEVKGIECEAMEYLYRTQHEHFSRLGLDLNGRVPRLSPGHDPGVGLADIEHSLCELEKYSRVKFPGKDGKKRIKKKFDPQGRLEEPVWPIKLQRELEGRKSENIEQ